MYHTSFIFQACLVSYFHGSIPSKVLTDLDASVSIVRWCVWFFLKLSLWTWIVKLCVIIDEEINNYGFYTRHDEASHRNLNSVVIEYKMWWQRAVLLRLSITYGLWNSKLNRQMRFSLPSIKCSAAPPRLPTTAERAVIKSLCRVQTTKQCSAVVVSWEDTPNIWLTAAKIEFIGGPFNLRVRMFLKRAVIESENEWGFHVGQTKEKLKPYTQLVRRQGLRFTQHIAGCSSSLTEASRNRRNPRGITVSLSKFCQ